MGERGTDEWPMISEDGQIVLRSSDPEIDFENTSAPDAVRRWQGCFVNHDGNFEIANQFIGDEEGPGWTNVQTYLQVNSPSTDTHSYGVQAFLNSSAAGFKALGGQAPSANAGYEWILSGANGNWNLIGGNTYWFLNQVDPGVTDTVPFCYTRPSAGIAGDMWFGGGLSWGTPTTHGDIVSGSGCHRDTSLSRLSPHTLGVGNGTAGDCSGNLFAKGGQFGTATDLVLFDNTQCKIGRTGTDAQLRLTRYGIQDWDIFAGTGMTIKAGGTTVASFASNGTVTVPTVNAATKFQLNGTNGATGSFTSADGKTVTVTGGLITGIV